MSAYLYRALCERIDKRFMRELRGDQDFLQRRGKGKYIHARLLHSGIVSFKADILDGWLYNPPFHKIVFFHGEPRPWQQEVIPY